MKRIQMNSFLTDFRAIVKRKPMIKAVNFKLLMLSYIRYKVTRSLNYLVEMESRQISFAWLATEYERVRESDKFITRRLWRTSRDIALWCYHTYQARLSYSSPWALARHSLPRPVGAKFEYYLPASFENRFPTTCINSPYLSAMAQICKQLTFNLQVVDRSAGSYLVSTPEGWVTTPCLAECNEALALGDVQT